jgi:hypothetical protein
MSKINSIIPSRPFELIGERIAQILAIELYYQTAATYDDTIDATVYYERSVPFDFTDLPAVNVSFAGTDNSNEKQQHKDSLYEFEIDIYTMAKTNDVDFGDKISTLRCHKLAGIIDFILSHPVYKTLDFPPGLIGGVYVKSLKINDPKGRQDAEMIKMARLQFQVRSFEQTTFQETTEASVYSTQVKIAETDKGYYYEFIP